MGNENKTETCPNKAEIGFEMPEIVTLLDDVSHKIYRKRSQRRVKDHHDLVKNSTVCTYFFTFFFKGFHLVSMTTIICIFAVDVLDGIHWQLMYDKCMFLMYKLISHSISVGCLH